MAEIIGSVYEIIRKLGAGGGGTVFLARHTHLDKEVVLKVDKRKLSTSTEMLRREVDILKHLKHQHIPQVYDFFIEEDRTVTVMDYIKGESLDQPLRRGERFPQPQVIAWAKELLSALSYLHSPTHGEPPKGYVHSDIKPANIMRQPDNEVCLIDFNIALAIGELNIVGKSPGYASPEHYGIDFSSRYDSSKEETVSSVNIAVGEDASTVLTDGTTKMEGEEPPKPEAKTAEDKPTVIEATSDEDKATVIESRTAFENRATVIEGQGDPDDQATVSGTVSEAQAKSKPVFPGSSVSTASVGSLRKIVPDVRSDIYSLGATLYHLLSGTRPDKDALSVVPLKAGGGISAPVADIINKAMSPNPDMRYQTADEMLEAFDTLRALDPRVIRAGRGSRIAAGVFSVLIAAGIFTSFVGLKRIQNTESALKNAEYSRAALEKGDVKGAVRYALEGLPAKNALFFPDHLAEPQKALADALGIYDLSDSYKSAASVTLPSAPLFVRLSPDGKNGACICAGRLEVFSAESGTVTAELAADASALSEVEFIDSERLIFAGAEGITCYDIPSGKTLWTGGPATAVSVSGNGEYAAAIYRDEDHAVIYKTSDGTKVQQVNFPGFHQIVEENDRFANLGKNLFELNEDGSKLGISFENAPAVCIDVTDGAVSPAVAIPEAGYNHFTGGFADGVFVVSGVQGINSEIGAVNTADGSQPFPAIDSVENGAMILRTYSNKIYLKQNKDIFTLDPHTGRAVPLISADRTITAFDTDGRHILAGGESSVEIYDISGQRIAAFDGYTAQSLCCVRGGCAVFGNGDMNELRILRYESSPESVLADYPVGYAHNETRVSADGGHIMQFGIEGFRILDMNGSVLCEKLIDDPGKMYDQQYRRNEKGSYLEVTYLDGRVICYDSSTGDIIEERTEGKPDTDAPSVFNTDRFRIESPLHGKMVIYDSKSGKKLGEIEKNGYLSYVYQIGGYTVLQMFDRDIRSYGIILDGRLKEIAEVPYLCDVSGERLVMDYPTGTIKVSGIYSVDELMEKANQ